MNVAIYATPLSRSFIAVLAGATPPAQATRLFKRVTLEAGKPRIGLNPDEVMAAIESQGWAIINLG